MDRQKFLFRCSCVKYLKVYTAFRHILVILVGTVEGIDT